MSGPNEELSGQAPEVKECRRDRREYDKEYYQKHRLEKLEYHHRYYQKRRLKRLEKEDPNYIELVCFMNGGGNLNDNNDYVSLLLYLGDNSYGKKYKELKRCFGNVRGRLMKLRNLKLIVYENNRHKLSAKGQELIEEIKKNSCNKTT